MTQTFQSKLFIGIGETQAYYTLRETYLHVNYIPGEGPSGNSVVNGKYQGQIIEEVRSFHHYNLSQDIDEAIAKAKMASENLGIPLSCNKDEVEARMRSIERRTAEEIAESIRVEEEKQRIWEEARRERWLKEQNEAIQEFNKTGLIQVGRHFGRPLADLPKDYFTWLTDSMNDFDKESFIYYMAKFVIENHQELIPKKIDLQKETHFGTAKERVILENIQVLRVRTYDGYYGRVYITTLASEDGICFVVKSGAFRVDPGETLNIKATIKGHDTYNGQAQTILQRVAIIK